VQKIEGEYEYCELVSPATTHGRLQAGEVMGAIRGRKAELCIEDRGLGRNGLQDLREDRQALPPIIAAAVVEADCRLLLDHLKPVAVQFQFVHPPFAGGYAGGRYRAAGLDELDHGDVVGAFL
jgi:hypothetical protein